MTWQMDATNRSDDHGRLSRLPKPLVANIIGNVVEGRRLLDPDAYLPTLELLEAVNTAIALGLPLLLTGEPGNGKTQLAYYVASRLGLTYEDEVIRFDVKSTTEGRDILYRYDAVSHFHAANNRHQQPDVAEFIEFGGLGRAILESASRQNVAHLLGRWGNHKGTPRRAIVLIDEIDKAARNVPNDLLREIETMEFSIPELGPSAIIRGDPALRPIVFITSNTERALPDAFLRRCCFYEIPFPSNEQLRDIIARRISVMPREAGLVGDAMALFGALRSARARISKKPGVAELLAFVSALVSYGYRPESRLAKATNWQNVALTILVKSGEDRKMAELIVNDQARVFGELS